MAALAPMTGLQAALAETEPVWQANLLAMHRRGHYVLGEQVARFEAEFAAAIGAAYSVGVGTGTAAIELCLRAAGITSCEQEVLVPTLTSLFTAQAVLAAGATPRFVDVDPEHLLMDPEQIKQHGSSKTAAVIAVHLYGQPCAVEQISALCAQRDWVLIQDACQAHGARRNRQPLTSYSPFVAFSFYPTKNLGALGDGGAVATSEAGVRDKLRMLRDGGRVGDQVSRLPAINSRLDEIQACYLSAFLSRLDEWNACRGRLSALYDSLLQDCPGVSPVRHQPGSVHHLYVVRAEQRDSLRESLAQRGIATGVHYPVPLHLQPAFRSQVQPVGSLPVAEQACQQIISLPLWPHLPESAVEDVAEQVRRFYR